MRTFAHFLDSSKPMSFKYPVKTSEITPPEQYHSRRHFLKTGLSGAAGLWLGATTGLVTRHASAEVSGTGAAEEKWTSLEDVTRHNNFYEFGTDKTDPARNAHTLKTRPWTVQVEGEVAKPRHFDLDDLHKLAPLEERVYRLRCVEGWSMVIPWLGFPLAALLKQVEPTRNAHYVEFITLMDAEQMPGQKRTLLDWPYTEGLRIDEATHPLTLLALGLYGKELPNQNGAPVRLVVPWKYGFKSAKSLVRIRLTEKMPQTTWNLAVPAEYGFYANVNPAVDHPRWSQARERRIGEFFRRPTLLFNGYADQVASLYSGMDLARYY